jgi:hypothetical protein
MSRPTVSELSLARAWADAAIPSSLQTTDGIDLHVVYRGAWTHGFGPDFSGAMISFADGRFLTGSVEIHLASSGWRAHGHHLDPAYNDVILHVVGVDDGHPVRKADGSFVPTAIVGFEQAKALEANLDWSRVGGAVCAEDLSTKNPTLIIQAIQKLGDQRLAGKAASFEAELVSRPPAEILWKSILEALGYAENREPMRRLARIVTAGGLQRLLAMSETKFVTAATVLLGVGGFLPLSPVEADIANVDPSLVSAIETSWSSLARPITELMSPGEWHTARVRPANHPVSRLLVAAAFLAEHPEGVTAALLEHVRAAELEPHTLIAMATKHGASLGIDRATVLLANAVLPFALALSEHANDPELTDGAMRLWDSLPASAHNRVTRAAQLQVAGSTTLKSLGERGMQGLIHLNRSLCAPRRCFECPVAALVVGEDSPG